MKHKTCPCCNGLFVTCRPGMVTRNGNQKVPLLLRCGHTFCQSCLSQKIAKVHKKKERQKQTHLTCPTCKETFSLPNGIKDLRTNLYLMALLEYDQISKLEYCLGDFIPEVANSTRHKKASKSSEFFVRKCRLCNNSDASCRCVECDNVLCTDCFHKLHASSAAICKHKPVPLLHDAEERSSDQNCQEHERPVEYYCIGDGSAICSRCYIMGSHKGHSIISYEEKNKELLTDIEVETEAAEKVLHCLETSDDKLASFMMPSSTVEMKKVVQGISDSFINLHTLLQVQEMKIVESLTQVCQNMSASLEEKREQFSIQRRELLATIKDAKCLMENNGLVIDSANLLEKLRGAKTIPCVIKSKGESEGCSMLTWEESNKDEAIRAFQSFGTVTGNPLDNLEFLTVEEAPVGYEDQDNDDKISITSSVSSVYKGRPQVQRAESSFTAESSEGVIIEYDNSDADSDVPKSSKTGSLGRSIDSLASNASKQQLTRQESICLPVVKGRPQHASVTHIVSPNDFMIQLSSNKRKLETLSHNINSWCRRDCSAKHRPSQVDVGSLVLAKYSVDKAWYRAKVIGIVEDESAKSNPKVHVVYIDYGNEEVVSHKDMRNMEKRFMIYPEFAVRCSLHDIAPYYENVPWSPECVTEFQKMTEGQVFLLSTIAKTDEAYDVDLVCMPNENVLDDGYVSVRDILVFLELGRFKVHSTAAKNMTTPPSYRKVEFIKPTSVRSGAIVDVIVTSVDSPSSLHITCQGDERAYYLNMLDEMQDMYSQDTVNMYALYYPRAGCVCSVKAKDERWYRAQVISPPCKMQVTVCLVDLGATLVVSCSNIKKLHSKFIKLPIQALHCCLADVAPLCEDTDEWSAEAKKWSTTTMVEAVGMARIKRWSEPSEIVLWLGSRVSAPTNQSINFLLVERGLAKSTGLSSVGVTQKILYDTGNSNYPIAPKASVLQGGGGAAASGAKQAVRLSQSQAKSPTSPKAGQPQHEKAVEVGREVNEKKRGKRVPGQRKGRQQQQQSLKQTEGPTKVETEEDQKDVEAKQLREKVQREIQRAMSNDGGGDDASGSVYIEVIISRYSSPSDFVLRVQESEMKLDTLMENMQLEYSNSPPAEDHAWNLEEFCAAKFSEDGRWYRARISSRAPGDKFVVEMVDYGYEEAVESTDLRPLTKTLGQFMNCAAVKCHMANLLPAGSMDPTKWSRTATEFMRNETKDRKLYIKQEGDVNELGLPIDIIVELEIPETAFDPAIKTYHSLRQAILDEGLAMAKKSDSQPVTPESEKIHPFQRVIFEPEAAAAEEVLLQEAGICDTESASSTPVESEVGASFETDPLILPSYPDPTIGEPLDVFPTYVDFDGIVYVQLKEWEDTVIHLDYELQRVYRKATRPPNRDWKVGDICVSYYPADDRWYRATILKLLEGDQVMVQYIDYGNSETVECRFLREMLQEFANIHPLALHCQLVEVTPISQDGRWPLAVLEYMQDLIVNAWSQIIIMNVEESKQVQVILTTADGLEIGQHLVDKGVAFGPSDMSADYQRSASISSVLATSNPYPVLEPGGVGDMFTAILTHVELPNLIYLQYSYQPDTEDLDFVKSGEIAKINSMGHELESITERLNYSHLKPMTELPDPGCMCAARFSFNDTWYRGLIIESNKKERSCVVLYVDFGNSEEVQLDRICELPTDSWSLPAQAMRVYFNIVPPGGARAKWSKYSADGLIEALANREIMVKILQLNPLTVELLAADDRGEMRLAYESLLEAGLAHLPQEVEAWRLSSATVRSCGGYDEDGEDDVVVEGRERGALESYERESEDVVEGAEAGDRKAGLVLASESETPASTTEVQKLSDSTSGVELEKTLTNASDNDSGDSDEWTTDDDDEGNDDSVAQQKPANQTS